MDNLSNGLGIFIVPIKFSSKTSTYNDYLDFTVEAERFGYTDVYIGEHLTDHREDIQSSLIFAAALAAKTSTIKISLCALPLPHYDIRLLVKQLEDLHKLSNGRLHIGYTPGALKTDLAYLGINPSNRITIFEERLTDLISSLQSSDILHNVYPSKMFATLLAGKPEGCRKVFSSGCSAFSSNFIHPDFLSSHALNLQAGLVSPSEFTPRWNIGLNIAPLHDLHPKSVSIIKDSLHYIYSKLIGANINKLMEGHNWPSGISELTAVKSMLLKNLIYEDIPTTAMETAKSNRNIFGQYVINLFDCIDDMSYTSSLLSLPKKFIRTAK